MFRNAAAQILNLQRVKYFLRLMCQASVFLVLGVDLTMLKRIIIDLTARGLSLNHIRQHLYYIYAYPISKESIQAIQEEASTKATIINKSLDKTVAPRIKIAESDEIFQGESVILAIGAKGYNYLMGMHKRH